VTMSELRKDPVSGRWVIIAPERATRPADFQFQPPSARAGFCPFCEGNEDKTPPEIAAFRAGGSRANGPGWRVRAVPNKFPVLRVEASPDNRGVGTYDCMNGLGAHEIIVNNPRHCVSLSEMEPAEIEEALWMCRERLTDLKRDSRLTYGLLFQNVGAEAGSTLEHSHFQLIVLPVVPIAVERELDGAARFHGYRGRCLFCDLIRQELADCARIVDDEGNFVVFAPYASRFPFEMWILPKMHASHFEDMTRIQAEELSHVLRKALRSMETALRRPPYNLVVHTMPLNQGNVPHYHWHIEVLPRVIEVAGFEWGADFYINPVAPESAAAFMRGESGE